MADSNEKHVETLLQKAASAADSNEAQRFAQAALNAAHALCSLKVLKS
jgi:hypothetical protein